MQIDITPSLLARFWAKVDKDGPVPPHRPHLGPCWLWTDVPQATGYGTIGLGGRGTGKALAHRIAWVIARGPIPVGLFVLHHCDTPPCVNPDHLFLGDNTANMRDMAAKGRQVFQAHPERIARGERHWSALTPDRVPRGERGGRAYLTEANVVEMRRLYEGGAATQTELAARFGTTQANVHLIVSRKNWRHVL